MENKISFNGDQQKELLQLLIRIMENKIEGINPLITLKYNKPNYILFLISQSRLQIRLTLRLLSCQSNSETGTDRLRPEENSVSYSAPLSRTRQASCKKMGLIYRQSLARIMINIFIVTYFKESFYILSFILYFN
jgi:hypothetical protein